MILKKIFYPTLGKKQFQKFYEHLFKLSLLGMNFGEGSNFKDSGELNVFDYMKKKLQSEDKLILFDIGANIGNYAKTISHFFGEKAIIYSFEPSKKTYEHFLNTVKECTNVIPNNVGMSSEKQQVSLYYDTEESGLASVYKRDISHCDIFMNICEEIELTTIDDFCREELIGRINFVKIDIEGHELAALEGAKNMINEDRIDFIQFEFGGTCIDAKVFFRDYFNLLKDKYKIYRILKNGLWEIKNYDELDEIFYTVNYLAERRV